MKNKQIEKGIRGLQETQISPAEKQAILAHLMETIKDTRTAPQRSWGVFIFDQFIWRQRFSQVVAVCLILLMLSGGTLYASETALPGDLLYPIKINIMEPAGDILAVSLSDKTKREVEKVSRRLSEAEKLASEGRLSSNNVQVIKKQLDAQTDKFNRLTTGLAKTVSLEEIADIHSNFEAQITAHAHILQEVSDHAQDSQKTIIAELAKEVDKKIDFAKKDTSKIESKLAEKRSQSDENDRQIFEKNKQEVKNKIKNTQRQLDKDYRNAKGLTKDILENASGTLNEAQKKIEEAEESNRSGKGNEALNSLFSANRDTEEARTSVKKSKDFKQSPADRNEKEKVQKNKDRQRN